MDLWRGHRQRTDGRPVPKKPHREDPVSRLIAICSHLNCDWTHSFIQGRPRLHQRRTPKPNDSKLAWRERETKSETNMQEINIMCGLAKKKLTLTLMCRMLCCHRFDKANTSISSRQEQQRQSAKHVDTLIPSMCRTRVTSPWPLPLIINRILSQC